MSDDHPLKRPALTRKPKNAVGLVALILVLLVLTFTVDRNWFHPVKPYTIN